MALRALKGAGRLAAYTVQVVCLVHLVNQHIVEIRACKGASMLPTLAPSGDLVLHVRLSFLRFLAGTPFASDELASRYPRVNKNLPSAKIDPAAGTGLKIGDVVVAVSPADPTRTVCKRVLGLPGDTVLVDPRDVLHEPPAAPGSIAAVLARMHSARAIIVPKGHVWLAGDNLANSTDSRHYGAVPLALVKGRVLARLYPHMQWLRNNLNPVS
ncbi:hypothetical protein MCUN1_001024 [Malassezia cuniculi]|uniref:Mitochondrial inner membrane protease subunit n=1 Tax=Malassezia cuniculi TaxID=948313 RepID=A0AAF0ETD9_9BASI|nr:hypothetical protein MCUN1_001024 [Malassezia cuniculi]